MRFKLDLKNVIRMNERDLEQKPGGTGQGGLSLNWERVDLSWILGRNSWL